MYSGKCYPFSPAKKVTPRVARSLPWEDPTWAWRPAQRWPPVQGPDWKIVLACIFFWLVVSNPLKNMNVNWDEDIPNLCKNRNRFRKNNQF